MKKINEKIDLLYLLHDLQPNNSVRKITVQEEKNRMERKRKFVEEGRSRGRTNLEYF